VCVCVCVCVLCFVCVCVYMYVCDRTIDLLYFDIQKCAVEYNQMEEINFNLVIFSCKETIFCKHWFILCCNISN